MKTIIGWSLGAIIALFNLFLPNQEIIVNSINALETVANSAAPGDIIILQDGTYQDTVFNIQNNGTAENPIYIQAESVGGVVFKGRTKLRVGGSHIVLDGFSFDSLEWLPTDSGLIVFKLGDTTDACDNCVVTNFEFQGRPQAIEDTIRSFVWLSTFGRFNEISHSSFLDKQSRGTCMRVNRTKTLAVFPDQHNIHHNYFSGRRAVLNHHGNPFNGQEALVIGSSNDPSLLSECAVYNNFVYDWLSESEVFSSKSSGNLFYQNSFVQYKGALSLRKGHGCQVYRNFFLAMDTFPSGGIRLYGEDHLIYNNYIAQVQNKNSNFHGGVNLGKGEPVVTSSSYDPVKNVVVAFNTFVGCDKAILVGTEPDTTATIAPTDVLIANNIFTDGINELKELDPNSMVTYLANTIEGDSCIDNCLNDNIKTNTTLLTTGASGGFRRLVSNSIAIDSAKGDFSWITRDIKNAVRPTLLTARDRGAEEREAIDTLNQVYNTSATHIGRRIGAGSDYRFRCNANLNLAYFNHPEGTYQSRRFIRSKANVLADKTVHYKGRDSIIMINGFRAYAGSNFQATIEDCSMPANLVDQASLKAEALVSDPIPLTFNVFPNPASGEITIAFELKSMERVSLEVHNSNGSSVFQWSDPHEEAGSYQKKINLPIGLYVVVLQVGQERVTRKLIRL